ncbi:hypothetical protein [Cytobacillus horneckiae]|uniref:hypothetical protein n=1 Tax=Cytobacillus horneckiae TaxID=549687 RepID=UPI003D9A789D
MGWGVPPSFNQKKQGYINIESVNESVYLYIMESKSLVDFAKTIRSKNARTDKITFEILPKTT